MLPLIFGFEISNLFVPPTGGIVIWFLVLIPPAGGLVLVIWFLVLFNGIVSCSIAGIYLTLRASAIRYSEGTSQRSGSGPLQM
jgi:hypothetical protein